MNSAPWPVMLQSFNSWQSHDTGGHYRTKLAIIKLNYDSNSLGVIRKKHLSTSKNTQEHHTR